MDILYLPKVECLCYRHSISIFVNNRNMTGTSVVESIQDVAIELVVIDTTVFNKISDVVSSCS